MVMIYGISVNRKYFYIKLQYTYPYRRIIWLSFFFFFFMIYSYKYCMRVHSVVFIVVMSLSSSLCHLPDGFCCITTILAL